MLLLVRCNALLDGGAQRIESARGIEFHPLEQLGDFEVLLAGDAQIMLDKGIANVLERESEFVVREIVTNDVAICVSK